MDKKQCFNPYLPSYEYVPDGEPHVFGDRLYLYGSHDRFRGADFCLNDYVCYSAPVRDLTDWRYEGVIYRKEQDPRNQNIPEGAPASRPGFCAYPTRTQGDLNGPGIHAMFAPDVVRGPDGRYYLYYCLDVLPQIGVAVCDTPAGKYEFLGFVRHRDGTVLGEGAGDAVQFDPGVFLDDDGTVYLYSGNSFIRPEQNDGKYHHSQVMTLEPDMLTLKTAPRELLPSIHETDGTGFEGHAFFEASSIRKAGGLYYLVYSSVNSHELCYAVSRRPDGGYRYGGTLVDIGDVYLNGREARDALNPLGNTHGGMECVNGQWYIFYHRQTDRTNYSRQACAEKISIRPDGSIAQAEVTSCGMNAGPLAGEGPYPAGICCHLRGKRGVNFSHPLAMGENYPYLTQDVPDLEPDAAIEEPVQYIANMADGAQAGYKYFRFRDTASVTAELRGHASGRLLVKSAPDGEVWGEIPVELSGGAWQRTSAPVSIPAGDRAVYFCYEGSGSFGFRSFVWNIG